VSAVGHAHYVKRNPYLVHRVPSVHRTEAWLVSGLFNSMQDRWQTTVSQAITASLAV